MTDRIRLPLVFDPARLQADLRSLRDVEWIAHFVKQNYTGDWSVIPLRGPAGATHPVMMIYSDPACEDFEDTPYLHGCPYIREVLGNFRCPLLAVRLMKLAAGSEILEHTDHDLDAALGQARLHIPVTTGNAVDFRLNGERVLMRAGECWYLRLSDPHSVSNTGEQDRVHLVIDAHVNDWLRELLAAVPVRADQR